MHEPNKKVTFQTAPLITVPKIVTSKNSPIIKALTSRIEYNRSFHTSVTTLRKPKSVTSFSSKTRFPIFNPAFDVQLFNFRILPQFCNFFIFDFSITFLTITFSTNTTTEEGKDPHYNRLQKKARALTTTTEEGKPPLHTTISDRTVQYSSCSSNLISITDKMSSSKIM